jgi:hypothetical protein
VIRTSPITIPAISQNNRLDQFGSVIDRQRFQRRDHELSIPPRRGERDPSKAAMHRDPGPGSRGTHWRENSAEEKWCTGCLQTRPICEFMLPWREADRCRSCRAEPGRRWRERNPEAVAAYNESRRIGPREGQCDECGESFTAGQRGPVSDRCRRCRRTRKLEQRRERHRKVA